MTEQTGLLTDALRARIGETRTYTAPEEIGRAAIRYFALAVGDDNPLYTDAEYARRHGHSDVVVPPTLIFETNQYAGLPRDDVGYAGHSWDLDVPGTSLVRGGNTYTFHQAAGPDTVLHVTWRLADMQERTNRGGRQMLIVSSEASYRDQHDTLLAVNVETLIYAATGAE
ncbi:hypothetical protein GCM10027290_01400 [Micromonospora sonneratiae]|uniref:MaoC family dehydratase N-terminal domain-containing protein n=1 Tax=Micromonospora sonneratiae TaxID=1184706 RepID=A0ABW3Y5L5_9ACTN